MCLPLPSSHSLLGPSLVRRMQIRAHTYTRTSRTKHKNTPMHHLTTAQALVQKKRDAHGTRWTHASDKPLACSHIHTLDTNAHAQTFCRLFSPSKTKVDIPLSHEKQKAGAGCHAMIQHRRRHTQRHTSDDARIPALTHPLSLIAASSQALSPNIEALGGSGARRQRTDEHPPSLTTRTRVMLS